MNKEQQIINTWHANASVWIKAIQHEEIASRVLVTNQAIVDAVIQHRPRTALDVGCGEGWLSHILYEKGIQTTGIDAVPALVEKARQQGSGTFNVCSYDDLAQSHCTFPHLFEAIIFNFSLFGEASVKQVLTAVKNLLLQEGHIFIQTLHPLMAYGDQAYKDGWREGSWAGFNQAFTNPAPWYFRTLQGWISLFKKIGLQVIDLIEPIHPETQKPASVIFICSKAHITSL